MVVRTPPILVLHSLLQWMPILQWMAILLCNPWLDWDNNLAHYSLMTMMTTLSIVAVEHKIWKRMRQGWCDMMCYDYIPLALQQTFRCRTDWLIDWLIDHNNEPPIYTHKSVGIKARVANDGAKFSSHKKSIGHIQICPCIDRQWWFTSMSKNDPFWYLAHATLYCTSVLHR